MPFHKKLKRKLGTGFGKLGTQITKPFRRVGRKIIPKLFGGILRALGQSRGATEAELQRQRELVELPGRAQRTGEQRASPLLEALAELQRQQEPGVRRRAFTPFAQRGFGASGIARRGVTEALGGFEARFARERERIRSEQLRQAIDEELQLAQIRALQGA